ncbi:MAG TPA: hypothetical protein VMV65_04470 [Alphaproteobacteria bacterium]|nr:hypothetical protein [Alphaproteobacteria bacterium]
MKSSTPKSLSWRDILDALRASAADSVVIRDGRETAPAGIVRTRRSAKGTELCLFTSDKPASRQALIEQLVTLSALSGRRFMASARAQIANSALLVESVADEDVGGISAAVVRTRRPKLGFNQSQQIGSSTTLRSKRIKTG